MPEKMKHYDVVEAGFDAISTDDFIIGCRHLRPGGDGLLTSVRIAVLDHAHCDDVKALLCKHCESLRGYGRLEEGSLIVLGLAADALEAELADRGADV